MCRYIKECARKGECEVLKRFSPDTWFWMLAIEMHCRVQVQFHNSVECPYLGIVVLTGVHILTAIELSQL